MIDRMYNSSSLIVIEKNLEKFRISLRLYNNPTKFINFYMKKRMKVHLHRFKRTRSNPIINEIAVDKPRYIEL